MKLCAKCKIEKDKRAFSKGTPWCKSCKSKYDKEYRSKPEIQIRDREINYKDHIYRQYKLRIEDVAALSEKQNYKCAICSNGLSDVYDFTVRRYGLAIDHDHSCCPGDKSCGECIRGLLCRECNLLLGHSRDDINRLQNAIKYLKKTSRKEGK